MRAHNAFRRLNAFHLRHGDVHQHHVRRGAVVFRDGRAAIAGFAHNLAAKGLNHLGHVLAREDRIVYHQVPDRLAVFAYQHWICLHDCFSLLLQLNFYCCSTNSFRIALYGQRVGQHVQRDDAHGVPAFNRRLGHAKNGAGIFALRDGQRARVFHHSQPFSSVIAHAGHQYPDRSAAELARYGRNRMSTDGRCPFMRASSESTTVFPSGMRRTFMCLSPGQISARPAIKRSPDCASFTSMAHDSSSLRENMSVNPSGICWTTTMLPGKSPGNCCNRYCSAFGPPVEIPIAMILLGSRRGRNAILFGLGRSSTTGAVVFRSLLLAATLILLIRSRAISSMCAEAASRGLATKSNAPRASALKVALAPSVVSALTTITGTRNRRVIWRSVSRPSMRGISRSSVTTSGRRSSIFFSPNAPSIAVPTTSISLSRARICGINLRISAESSTTRTRNLLLMLWPPPSATCRALQLHLKDSGSTPPCHRPGWKRR